MRPPCPHDPWETEKGPKVAVHPGGGGEGGVEGKWGLPPSLLSKRTAKLRVPGEMCVAQTSDL